MNETTNNLQVNAEMTAELVAAYVSRNSVPMADLPNLIRSIHSSLASLGSAPTPQASAEPLRPAVPVRKSVTDDYIISLEDGRKFKSMKRYLSGLGMTPAEYRAKWGLPPDYPMVAPSYAAKRSELARSSGLGRKAAEAGAAPELDEELDEAPAEPASADDAKKPRKRGPKTA